MSGTIILDATALSHPQLVDGQEFDFCCGGNVRTGHDAGCTYGQPPVEEAVIEVPKVSAGTQWQPVKRVAR